MTGLLCRGTLLVMGESLDWMPTVFEILMAEDIHPATLAMLSADLR